jgi:hypothetical protein
MTLATIPEAKALYPKIPYAIVAVEWVDASRLAVGWADFPEEISEPDPTVCVSIGFLVRKNAKGIILVPNVADVKNIDNQHVYGGMMIPKSAIRSIRTLRK